MIRRDGKGGARVPIAGLFLLLSAGLFASCGDWVSLGPLLECGRRCDAPQGLACAFGISQYNRAGECVCGEVVDCPEFVCEPSPPDPTCFIAQYAQSGECRCTVFLKEGTCGQPCTPEDAQPPCESGKFEYNGLGDCTCGPAVCSCGQPCVPGEKTSDCFILNQYDETGSCVCAPAVCSACEDNPCCNVPCGEECTLPSCEPGHDCTGRCNVKNQCAKEPPKCVTPK